MEQIIESWRVGIATQNEAGFKQLMKVIGDISCDYVYKMLQQVCNASSFFKIRVYYFSCTLAMIR